MTLPSQVPNVSGKLHLFALPGMADFLVFPENKRRFCVVILNKSQYDIAVSPIDSNRKKLKTTVISPNECFETLPYNSNAIIAACTVNAVAEITAIEFTA